MDFAPEIVPPSEKVGSAWWFAFSGNRLLVGMDAGSAVVPCVDDPASLGLEPIRTQYLGRLDGRPCYSAEYPPDAKAPGGMVFQGLRQLFGVMEEGLFRIAGRAIQIVKWDQRHQYCGRCGSPTVTGTEDRAKVCPECGLKHFPRISPAVIVAIRKGKEILLARSQRFPRKLYSVLAGFVEPGETLEACLEREVREEVGIEIGDIRYFGSQSWPFPDSLMVAFTAEYRGGEITIDETEIVDAGWFPADKLPPIPDRISIARKLIDWFVENFR
jgi:NAD+ diphosphatase